jgi:hypothetical protein
MKKIVLSILFLSFFITIINAQEDKDQKSGKTLSSGFYTGGNSVLSFFGGNYAAGLNPLIGYRAASSLDFGAYLNYTYLSMPKFSNIYAYHQHLKGAGGYLRIFPTPFLFAIASAEYNSISNSFISLANRNDVTPGTDKRASMFAGIGYAHNRLRFANKPFFSLALLWDVSTDELSPYKDNKSKPFPIIKFGYNLPLSK